jgi:hypothetical protein
MLKKYKTPTLRQETQRLVEEAENKTLTLKLAFFPKIQLKINH